MKNQIMDYLQYSSEVYDDKKFLLFWAWCQKYGQTPSHTQQLLSNTQVFNWWNLEYTKLENQFLSVIEQLPKRMDLIQHHFYGFTVQIFSIFPKPLMDAIAKNVEKQEINLIKKIPNYHAN